MITMRMEATVERMRFLFLDWTCFYIDKSLRFYVVFDEFRICCLLTFNASTYTYSTEIIY